MNQTGFSGHADIISVLGNVAYDLPLSDKWDFTFGGGLGVGIVDA